MVKVMNDFMSRLRALTWSTNFRKIVTSVTVVLVLASFVIRLAAPVPPPHVSLSGQPLFPNGPSWLTNSTLTTVIVDIVLLVLVLFTRIRMKEIPSGIQNFMELLVEGMYGLAESVAGKNAAKFFPWSMSIFLFVILCNWSGLVPGVGSIGFFYHPVENVEEGTALAPTLNQRSIESKGFRWDGQLAMAGGNLILAAPERIQAAPVAAEEGKGEFVPLFRAPSADLNMTVALALSTMIMVQVWGVRFLGRSYFRKFFTFSGPNGFMKGINAFVGILELISEFARIISFSFRLFGNIFAGEIVLATMAFLFAFLLPVPFYGLEVFVGFVQALVFMMLSLVFFHMASVSHAEHEEHH